MGTVGAPEATVVVVAPATVEDPGVGAVGTAAVGVGAVGMVVALGADVVTPCVGACVGASVGAVGTSSVVVALATVVVVVVAVVAAVVVVDGPGVGAVGAAVGTVC